MLLPVPRRLAVLLVLSGAALSTLPAPAAFAKPGPNLAPTWATLTG